MREALAAAAGADALLDDAGAARFAGDGEAPCVVAPADAAAAAAVLELCTRRRWRVGFAGGGTTRALRPGGPPADVVLSAVRMAGVRAYRPEDLTVGAGAGTTLDALADAVGAAGQELPFDPPAAPGATVGAVAALAAAGPLRLSLGPPRDHVLGLDVVTGDGRMLRLGGRVVKNVAGYDLVRLFVGGRGAFGLITAVHLRLRARPAHDATLVFTADRPLPLLGLARAARRIEPAALELVSPALAAALGAGETDGAAPPWALLVRVRGNADAVEDACGRLAALDASGRAFEGAAGAALWRGLCRAEADAVLAVRFAALPSRVEDAVTCALDAARNTGGDADWCVAAHAGDGIARLWTAAAPGRSVLQRFALAVGAARGIVGSAHVVLAPPGLPAAFAHAPADAATAGLVGRLRAAFDPAGILTGGAA
jgi:FAD/FMN-containing dehydrogenase